HGEDHLPRAAREVLGESLLLDEDPGRLDHHVDPEVAPGDRRRVLLRRHRDLPAVDVEEVVVGRDRAVEHPHHRVVLQEVDQLLVVEQVVDRRDLQVGAGGEDAEDAAADAAEAVDADLDAHRAPPSAWAAPSSAVQRRTRSTTRWAYPQPLSNQVRVFDTWLPRVMVARLS